MVSGSRMPDTVWDEVSDVGPAKGVGMRRTAWMVIAVLCCLVVGAVTVGAAPYRVLLVDGTKTLEATLRVGGLAGAIRQSGFAEVSVIFSNVTSAFADPLVGQPLPTTPFDLIIIIPRGVGDGTSDLVWLLIAGSPGANPAASSALSLLSSGMGLVFGGGVRALGPLDDLWATLTASLYAAEGWLR
jgi:hypothetical protein